MTESHLGDSLLYSERERKSQRGTDCFNEADLASVTGPSSRGRMDRAEEGKRGDE